MQVTHRKKFHFLPKSMPSLTYVTHCRVNNYTDIRRDLANKNCAPSIVVFGGRLDPETDRFASIIYEQLRPVSVNAAPSSPGLSCHTCTNRKQTQHDYGVQRSYSELAAHEVLTSPSWSRSARCIRSDATMLWHCANRSQTQPPKQQGMKPLPHHRGTAAKIFNRNVSSCLELRHT
eukprot:SAG31_NODE_18_length_35375_cov_22.525315_11_plen_176_part_00